MTAGRLFFFSQRVDYFNHRLFAGVWGIRRSGQPVGFTVPAAAGRPSCL